MNATQLLAHFDRLSEAPGAVPRLRRFILDLAVRGKLVVQDAGDEPAVELLKRIQSPKGKGISSKKSTKHAFVPPSDIDEPFAIPVSWAWTHLTELGRTQTGATPSKSAGEVYGKHIPFVKPGDLLPSHVDYSGEGLSELGLKDAGRFAPAGSVLMVCIGTIGKCQMVDRDCSFNQQINSLSPNEGLESKYLLAAFMSEFFQQSAWAASARTTIAILNKGKWEQLPIPLPPLAEQYRIVAKVDELMALCDQLEAAQQERERRRDRLAAASLQRLNQPAADTTPEAQREHARFHLHHLPRLTTRPEHIKAMRQTFLNLAVRGKLVEQDSNDEPAIELLRKIRLEKSKRQQKAGRKAEVKLPHIDWRMAPYALPSGWTWARFPELGIFGRGKSKHRPRNDVTLFAGGTHLLVQTGDVARSKGVIKTFTSKYNDVGLAQSMKWPTGTLCITIAANIADSGILSFDACFPDSVVGFSASPLFDSARYFEYFVRTAKVNLLEFAPATAQKNINLEILNAVLIPLPPLAEQYRIVARVDSLMALCDQLEAQLTTTQTDSRRLLEAVLDAALIPV
ncbi:MAG: restriction endonuclease subunit S [Polaromonas sp.]|nr:restriction endonuclease subunit S [Polaromonas sp.]